MPSLALENTEVGSRSVVMPRRSVPPSWGSEAPLVADSFSATAELQPVTALSPRASEATVPTIRRRVPVGEGDVSGDMGGSFRGVSRGDVGVGRGRSGAQRLATAPSERTSASGSS